MPEPLRIDQARAAERELRQAFERGEFGAALREIGRGAEQLGVPLPSGFEELAKPGVVQDRFCYRVALAWTDAVTPEQRAGGVVEFALLAFKQLWMLAPVPAPAPPVAVLRLVPAPAPEPAPRRRSLLARLLLKKED